MSFPSDGCSITLVGSGVSTGVPVIGHLTSSCACVEAMRDPLGPNRRNNVSLLITVPDTSGLLGTGGECDKGEGSTTCSRHVLIDCGKTFRDAYFRVLAKHGVQTLDGLLLTHDHADAMAGLDDLRDLQPFHLDEQGNCYVNAYIPTYASNKTIQAMQTQFGYIARNSCLMGDAPKTAEGHAAALKRVANERKEIGLSNNIGTRRSTALQLFILPDSEPSPFYIPAFGDEFSMYAVPVEHGENYVALGFVFGRGVRFRSAGQLDNGRACCVYLSDLSAVPPKTMAFLRDLVKIDVLIVDMLLGPGQTHPSHYCMDDVMKLIETLQPARTYGIGMYCDLEHHKGNKLLQKKLEVLKREGRCGSSVISVELGYDGMQLMLPLL
ncbi:hypothetical protein TRVL_00199 [Trypanosoma vivax]|uniref:Metallo-beta-lactamase domain-containing protein n=1 Tax=Trypanosoma vivax (strain Y486) TaxID=1055687 RepID=G0TYC3_TRYVY|nr:hypothetical protein TRVL_00199 [Trypanosoma vivax]CCC48970.1 conserved hypothetical protein [Trypanosoma vivax Y486]